MEELVKKTLEESAEVKRKLASHAQKVVKLADACVDSLRVGGTIYLFGNGGSASDALHIAGELVGRFEIKRGALPAQALSANTATITAIANDFGYEEVFARQLQVVQSGDVAIGISTSGNSKNVIRGAQEARKRGAFTCGWTGEGGGELAGYVDLLIAVPSTNVQRTQEAHITLGHILCQLIEKKWQA